MKDLDPALAYRLLEAGPIVFVTTAHAGRANVMTMGFHMIVRHAPPLIGCVIGPWDHSHAALVETRECVIGVPTVDLAQKVVDIGNCSGEAVDKFERFGLTAEPAAMVQAPHIRECLANIECRIADDQMAADYDLFLLEPVAIRYDDDRKERRTLHHNGDGTFAVDGRTIDLRDRMVLWKALQKAL